MKLVKLYIVVLSLGVFLYSCEKKNVAPVQDSTISVPVWEDGSKARTGEAQEGEDGDENGGPVIDGITDPNSDPDGDKGGKTKKI